MNYMQLSITTVELLALAITQAKYDRIRTTALKLDRYGSNWMTVWCQRYLWIQSLVGPIQIERHTFCFIGENVTDQYFANKDYISDKFEFLP